MNKALRVTIAALIVLGLAGITGALMGASSPVQGGGITSHRYQTLVAGTTSYTTTVGTTGVDVGLFGAVQVHAIAAGLLSTQTMTVTNQFSGQTVACSSATQWVGAKEYLIFPSPVQAVSDTLLLRSVNEIYTITGEGAVNFEIPARGRCFRVLLSSDATTYTPTVYLRLVNRQ